jgi:hypothetical protein
MTNSQTGPRGGVTTIAPSGWQKTTVYLRPDQVRRLKRAAFDRDRTMSEVLRHSLDCYFGVEQSDLRLSEAQCDAVRWILRDQLLMKPAHVAEVLVALDEIEDR